MESALLDVGDTDDTDDGDAAGPDDGDSLGTPDGSSDRDTLSTDDCDELVLEVGIPVGAAVDDCWPGQTGFGTIAFIVTELSASDGDRLNMAVGGAVIDGVEGGSMYLYGSTDRAMLFTVCL